MHKRALCGTTLIAALAPKGERPLAALYRACPAASTEGPLLRRSGSGGCSGRTSLRCPARCLAPNRQLSGGLCRGGTCSLPRVFVIVPHYNKDAGACQIFSFGRPASGRPALSSAGSGGRRRKKSRIKGSEVQKVKRSARGWAICTPEMPKKAGSSPMSGMK